jgi:hypothetical protein
MSSFVRSILLMSALFALAEYAPPAQAQDVEQQASDPVFSGPQVGEALPAFKVTSLSGESEGRSFDPVADAKDQSIMLVFMHERTRPGFGLMRAVTNFAAEKKTKGMNVAVVFLTDDATETAKWSKNVQRMFSEDVKYGMSMEGKEGPGSYGLNRNVIVTVLVGKQGKVTGNFALVQPQLQVDGPKILKSIAAVSGGGKIPTMAELEPRYAGRSRMTRGQKNSNPAKDAGNALRDPKLTALLRGVINKQASAEEVRQAATKVDEYVAENEMAKKELARIASTVVNSGRLNNYGTPEAQKVLQNWSQKYGVQRGAKRDQNKTTTESSSEQE